MADDGHTVNVGYVHVLTEEGGPCRDDCPHPDHKAQSTEAVRFGAEAIEGYHLFQIPVDGFFHLYHMDDGISEEYVHKVLDQFNTGGVMLAEGVRNPARIEAKHDNVEAVVWFTPDPSLPENPRARTLVAEQFGWHMVFNGCVCISGLHEDAVAEFIRVYG